MTRGTVLPVGGAAKDRAAGGLRLVVALLAAVSAAILAVPMPSAFAGSTQPGALASSAAVTAYGLPGVALPAKAWHIRYWSRTAEGAPVQVSGTVLVPNSAWSGPGQRPLIGFAVGTQGLADRCAASAQLAAGTEYESAMLVQMLMRGWAVAVTDYQGLGTPGDHTYVMGHALGKDVLDSIRAARNLPQAGVPRSGPLAIYGYSEGGGGAAWALQLQPSYAPELRLTAGAVGAAPVDMDGLLAHIDGTPLAFLELYSAIGFNAAYPELRLDRYLNAAGRAAEQQMRDSCIEDAIVEAQLAPNRMTAFVTSNPLTSPAWRNRIVQNNLGFSRSPVPTVIGYSQGDEVFPFAQGQLLYRRWCTRGTNATLVTLPTPEHLLSGVDFSTVAIPYLADRLGGRPAVRPADCVPAKAPTGAGTKATPGSPAAPSQPAVVAASQPAGVAVPAAPGEPSGQLPRASAPGAAGPPVPASSTSTPTPEPLSVAMTSAGDTSRDNRSPGSPWWPWYAAAAFGVISAGLWFVVRRRRADQS